MQYNVIRHVNIKEMCVPIGNWFENSRLSFLTILCFIYCWSAEMTSIKFCKQHLNMNHGPWHYINYINDKFMLVVTLRR
jgi:hypothetical protein